MNDLQLAELVKVLERIAKALERLASYQRGDRDGILDD